jgi:hypothetical protein
MLNVTDEWKYYRIYSTIQVALLYLSIIARESRLQLEEGIEVRRT